MPMIVSLLGACAFRILWIATIFQIPRFHTVQSIYWSYPISWTLTLLAHVICLTVALRRIYRREGMLHAHRHLTHAHHE